MGKIGSAMAVVISSPRAKPVIEDHANGRRADGSHWAAVRCKATECTNRAMSMLLMVLVPVLAVFVAAVALLDRGDDDRS